MSVTRIVGPAGVVELDVAQRYSTGQRLVGLCCAAKQLTTSGVQAVASVACLPILPLTPVPALLGLQSVSNLRAGVGQLYRAASGQPPTPPVDADYLAGLCTDVQRTFAGPSPREGCEAAARLLDIPDLDLGDWRSELQQILVRGIQQVVDTALQDARAVRAAGDGAAAAYLQNALDWVEALPGAHRFDPAGFAATRRLQHALYAERWWLQAAESQARAAEAEAAGNLLAAEDELRKLIERASHNAQNDDRWGALCAAHTRVQERHLSNLHQAMRSCVEVGDWVRARRAAMTVLGYAQGNLAARPEAQEARDVCARANAVVGEAPVTFSTMEEALRSLHLATEWRLKQVDEARTLLGPGTSLEFETLADEIIQRHAPPENIHHYRIMHPRLPQLFYHPEANRHGPYIKMVPQTMLAAFACAVRADGQNAARPHQRRFFTEAMVDLCFEGRADALMAYVTRHPLDDAPPIDTEILLDFQPGMTDEAIACEHFRVFNAIQLRQYGAQKGFDFRAPEWDRMRPRLEASSDYTQVHCNAALFERYLKQQDFVRERADCDVVVSQLVVYLHETIGVL